LIVATFQNHIRRSYRQSYRQRAATLTWGSLAFLASRLRWTHTAPTR